eukprot:5829995-Prymnesium_polylepis.1
MAQPAPSSTTKGGGAKVGSPPLKRAMSALPAYEGGDGGLGRRAAHRCDEPQEDDSNHPCHTSPRSPHFPCRLFRPCIQAAAPGVCSVHLNSSAPLPHTQCTHLPFVPRRAQGGGHVPGHRVRDGRLAWQAAQELVRLRVAAGAEVGSSVGWAETGGVFPAEVSTWGTSSSFG